jgi:hypothetical protein
VCSSVLNCETLPELSSSHRILTHVPKFTLNVLVLGSYLILPVCFADDVIVGLPCVRINSLALLLCLFACGLL